MSREQKEERKVKSDREKEESVLLASAAGQMDGPSNENPLLSLTQNVCLCEGMDAMSKMRGEDHRWRKNLGLERMDSGHWSVR